MLRAWFQPLTVLWILLATVLLFTVSRRRRASGISDPFADQAPLTTYTSGVVGREQLAISGGVGTT